MLNNTISVTIPSTEGLDGEIPGRAYQARVREALEFIAGLAGGATALEGQGAYMADNGQLVIEKVTVVTGKLASIGFGFRVDDAAEWLRGKKSEWAQESMALEVNGVMRFI